LGGAVGGFSLAPGWEERANNMIEQSDGYKKLLASLKNDCEGKECMNVKGCSKQYPNKGHCFHEYCSKFNWVIERANHYSEKTGIPASKILDAWEERRNYWYMNYYQDSRQPLIKADNVRVFGTKDELGKSIGKHEFRCPSCGGVSKSYQTCDTGLPMESGKPCDWKSYGLFGTLGKGVTVFVKETLDMAEIFMPVAWEE
jgi:hypothetical protein